MRVLALLLLLASFSVPAADTPTPVPAAPAWQSQWLGHYDQHWRVAGLEQRDFQPEHWWEIVLPMLTPARGFEIETIASSVEGRPLRHVRWGEGKTSVMLWSQMHGNESTATMALADIFRFLGEQPDDPLTTRLRENLTLHLMPIANPDGTARFQRRNAQNIDINRDGRMLATPEAKALEALRAKVQPEFAFNLHDQNPGTRAGDTGHGVAIALLAERPDDSDDTNAVLARSIQIAAAMRIALEPHIGGRIARYDSTFNPRAFGERLAARGTSDVLVESGGIEGDLEKQILRRLNAIALLAALDAIATGEYARLPAALYEDLPENARTWPDLAIRGGTIIAPSQPPLRADVLVNFKHALSFREGKIADIGDLADVKARRSVEADGLFIIALDENGQPSTFTLDAPARLVLSRSEDGQTPVWALDGDADVDALEGALRSSPH